MVGSADDTKGPVLIIGGGSGMGAWLAEHLWGATGHEVSIADISGPGEKFEHHTLTFTDRGLLGLPDLDRFGTIVVATPIGQVGLVARTILSKISTPTIVVDIASVKHEVVNAIERALPEGLAEYVSIHPLFGPQVPSPTGQTFVVCPTGRCGDDAVDRVEQLIREVAGSPTRITPEEHDDSMAVVQLLTHQVALATAATLADPELDIDFRRTLTLLTPPFRALAGMVARVIDIRPPADPNGSGARIYADVQTAGYPKAQKIRDTFIKSACEIDALANESTPAPLTSRVESVAEHFPPDVLQVSAGLFAQSHAAAQAEAIELDALRRSAGQCGFRKLEDGRVRVGRIVEFTATAVALETHSTSCTTDSGRVEYGIAGDAAGRRSAAKLGFSIPPGRVEWISRSDHTLLSAAELVNWKRENLRHHARDITVNVPDGLDANTIIPLVPRLADGVIAASVSGRFRANGEATERVTIHLTLQGDREPEAVLDALHSALASFGLQIPARRLSPKVESREEISNAA